METALDFDPPPSALVVASGEVPAWRFSRRDMLPDPRFRRASGSPAARHGRLRTATAVIGWGTLIFSSLPELSGDVRAGVRGWASGSPLTPLGMRHAFDGISRRSTHHGS